MSHSPRSQIVSASCPLSATMTLASTSSTTRMRAVIARHSRGVEELADGFQEFADRDRFRQIGLAAALADAFLVAFHGERGDRDDRNALELRVVFEAFRHFEPGHLRELNVHEDQVGPMLAG